MDRSPSPSGNAVLNNAKAVATLDKSWANNRAAVDGHALVSLLEFLESLPYLARRDIARILRAWIFRVIELFESDPEELVHMSADDYRLLAQKVGDSETATRGVIEQRLVDALGVLKYSQPNVVSIGLGDSVNASNLSRRKFGDIEFIDPLRRSAIAVEAHAGTLTESYVDSHRHSLGRIIELRLEESFMALDEPDKWSIEVLFVARGLKDSLPDPEKIHGVSVAYSFQTFEEFRNSAFQPVSNSTVESVFNQYFIDPLNHPKVGQSVRDAVVKISDVY